MGKSAPLRAGFVDVVPRQFKLDYCAAPTGTWKDDWFSKVAWEFLTPGSTAVFLTVTGLWYFWKMENAQEPAARAAYKETALAFLLWGLFNMVIYVLLVWHQGHVAGRWTTGPLRTLGLTGAWGSPLPASNSDTAGSGSGTASSGSGTAFGTAGSSSAVPFSSSAMSPKQWASRF
jgi:hypothetical protein